MQMIDMFWFSLVVVAFGFYCKYFAEIAELIRKEFELDFETVEEYAWRVELTQHAAFYGAAVAAFLGFSHESIFGHVMAALWFVVLLARSKKAARLMEEKEEAQRRVQWQKTAGLIRSIFRSEFERAKRSTLPSDDVT